ncbi:hypothetical protein MHK_007869 [Candidatus Magnetomorum sp. HK-1]|nr:hypothetical protein MHK_007869 [Candidatus Magnetomorum sp. HK-1]
MQDINFDQHLIDPDRSLLNQHGSLLNIEDWIRRQKLREESNSLARIRCKNVIKLFERLLPNVSKIYQEMNIKIWFIMLLIAIFQMKKIAMDH